ncbi:MAG TPA: hypothetical protein VF427_02115, partial [Noviherbaspirillum sp.]
MPPAAPDTPGMFGILDGRWNPPGIPVWRGRVFCPGASCRPPNWFGVPGLCPNSPGVPGVR